VTVASPDDESRDRVTACLISSVPGLDDEAAHDVLAAARAEHGRALREIDALLKEHPEALVTTPAAYPLVLVRLAHSLTDAGYLTVTPPACTGCGKITTDLQRKAASGRVCGTCAARDSKGTCARCGQARRIYARRPEGGICSACYDKDEQVVTECSGCGRIRRAAAPDARRQRPLPVLRHAPGPHVRGLRPAAHRRRHQRCRAGLHLVLPGSAAAVRALRPDPQDRQAGDSIHS